MLSLLGISPELILAQWEMKEEVFFIGSWLGLGYWPWWFEVEGEKEEEESGIQKNNREDR